MYGLLKTSLVNYPGKVAAAVFLPGCQLRCPYCHNGSLALGGEPEDGISFSELISFLKKRKNILDALVISGGEPLLKPREVSNIIYEARNLGYSIKIDTNGLLPHALTDMDADYVSVDLKTSPGKYSLLGWYGDNAGLLLKETLEILKEKTCFSETRTTLVRGITENEDREFLAETAVNSDRYYLQNFAPDNALDKRLTEDFSFSDRELNEWQSFFTEKNIDCHIR